MNSEWTKYGEQHGINAQDPLFVNAAAGGFRLQVTSPAIGKAKVLSSGLSAFETFNYDIHGAPRINFAGDAAWDVGTFEYYASGNCHSNTGSSLSPNNLTVTAN